MTKALICGDRNWDDLRYVFDVMDELDKQYSITTVIVGRATGADTHGEWWANSRSKEKDPYPALWTQHDSYGQICWCPDKTVPKCRGAGHIRNRQMLEKGRPDIVVAFHKDLSNSKGTANMVKIAKQSGVLTMVFPEQVV